MHNTFEIKSDMQESYNECKNSHQRTHIRFNLYK